MVKLKDLARELKAKYVSFTHGGNTVTYKGGAELNGDEEIPKGAIVQYNEGKGWKEHKIEKGGKR